MAYHFSANQFEDQYDPKKLGNWEYPKWYPERPRQRFKSTKIIADDNGYVLEGYKKENPWGNYVGTWDLPRRITREYAQKLVAPPEKLLKRWAKKKGEQTEEQKPKQQEKHRQQEEQEEEEDRASRESREQKDCFPTIDDASYSPAQKSFQKRNKSSSALDLRPRPTKLQPLVSLERKSEKLHDLKPGILDEKIKRILESVQEKEDKQTPVSPELICKEIRALPKRTERKLNEIKPDGEPKTDGERNYFSDYLKEHESENPDGELDKQEEGEKPKMEKPIKTLEKPLKSACSGFQIAKRFHDENLRHKPLPDVIDDPVFKALNSGRQKNAGEALVVNSVPSAIGWKPYSAPRPTECSKLRIFRPKTGAEKQKVLKDIRPKTGDSGYKKHFLPIDLAICWDLKPEDPSDEPKRSPHIDGSNGSVAPAVFTMIRPTEPEDADQNISGSNQALSEIISKGIEDDNATTLPSQMNGKARTPHIVNKEAILSCVKTSKEGTPESLNSISPNAAEYARRHPKTAWTKEDTSKALSDRLQSLQKNRMKEPNLIRSPSESSKVTKKKHHQSTPNLMTGCDGSHCGTEKNSPESVKIGLHLKNPSHESENRMSDENKLGCDKNSKNEQKKRNCTACKKSTSECTETREKPEFKAAFKAGVPRSDSTNSGSSSAAKSYKVPKMRLPYAKRSYSIGTLAPPFSLWRESNGQEYPEHWRLASVYQHSYKPINFRKRPLLASVYQ